MNVRRLLLVVLCAVFAFGGSFTCKSETNSDKFTANPTTPAK